MPESSRRARRIGSTYSAWIVLSSKLNDASRSGSRNVSGAFAFAQRSPACGPLRIVRPWQIMAIAPDSPLLSVWSRCPEALGTRIRTHHVISARLRTGIKMPLYVLSVRESRVGYRRAVGGPTPPVHSLRALVELCPYAPGVLFLITRPFRVCLGLCLCYGFPAIGAPSRRFDGWGLLSGVLAPHSHDGE